MSSRRRIYTRTGDDGTTGLGTGARVRKDATRISAYGTVDELNSALGLAAAASAHQDLVSLLRAVQRDLFVMGADLCFPEEGRGANAMRMEERQAAALEQQIDLLEEELEPLTKFILPGGTLASAHMHLSRAICRRAERGLVMLAAEERISDCLITYLNRLSDLLFVMARVENRRGGLEDICWDGRS
ncbi:MAG: cob(I)yrinic acid a,c-diamide adenosyltransferase [Planctomycetota bacterium]